MSITDALLKGAEQIATKHLKQINGDKNYITVPTTNTTMGGNERSFPAQAALPAKSVVTDATIYGDSKRTDTEADTALYRSGKVNYGSKVLPEGALYARMKLRGRKFYAINPILLYNYSGRKHDVRGPHIDYFYGTWSQSPVGRDKMMDRLEEGLKK